MKLQKREMTSTNHNPISLFSLNWMNNHYTKTQKVLLYNLHYIQILNYCCLSRFQFTRRTSSPSRLTVSHPTLHALEVNFWFSNFSQTSQHLVTIRNILKVPGCRKTSTMALACGYHPLRCTVALPQRSATSRWRRAALGTGSAAAAVARSATVRRCLRTPRRSPVHILSACNECPGVNSIRNLK